MNSKQMYSSFTTEYTRQIKKLLKKYHPDLCKDENLQPLYNEITVKLNNILDTIKTREKITDQVYTYYKLGIQYYKNIHPGHLYKKNTNKTYETKTYEEQLEILNKIFISFNMADYYFNKVIEEYPNSEWTEDAREKIKLLKKLYKSYENIDAEKNNHIIDAGKFVDEMGIKTMF